MRGKISLDSKIFEEDPYQAFANQHKVSREIWVKMYHTGYLWRQYTLSELMEYLAILTSQKLKVSPKTIVRWIKRTNAYNKAQSVKKRGAKEASPEFFGADGDFVEESCKK